MPAGKYVRKRFGSINCQKHGTAVKGDVVKWVKVAVPDTKKKRLNGGCPMCKQEAEAARKLSERLQHDN